MHSGADLAYLTTANAGSSLFAALQVWLWGHTWVRQVGQRPAQALPEGCQGIVYADDSDLHMLASRLPHTCPAQPPCGGIVSVLAGPPEAWPCTSLQHTMSEPLSGTQPPGSCEQGSKAS